MWWRRLRLRRAGDDTTAPSPHLGLRDRWRTDEAFVEPCDPESAVRRLEIKYSLSLPQDFRRYLLEAAPGTDIWDDSNAIWWSVDNIKNIPDEYEHEVKNAEIAAEPQTYLFFADYMIWCWAWAVCCSNGPNRGKVALINGKTDRFIASSFDEFLAEFLRDADDVVTQH